MTVGRHILYQGRSIGGGGGGPPVPLDAIAMWSGTLVTIPANWNLCDGGGTTPNLVAKFIRGAPAATDPGATGGADTHTHASMTTNGTHTHTAGNRQHQHTVNSAGGHWHGALGSTNATGSSRDSDPRTAILVGAHQHTTNNSANHTHTMDSEANHTHPISTDDGRPPFYEVAYIQAAAGALVAADIVIIWTGTIVGIPAGWSLCDGGGARPDLRSTFVRGVNTAITNPGNVGGGATHLHTETAHAAHSHTMNAGGTHTHTFSAYTWTHSHVGLYIGSTDSNTSSMQDDLGAGDHTHAESNSTGSHTHNAMGNDGAHAHTVNAASSLPAYYDVAYIINDGGATEIPTSGVLIWTGLLVNIPVGYDLCDGGGGRPELRAKFLRGSNAGVDPGGGGGSDTHTHTDQNAGAHTGHSQTSAGAHQHAATDTLGAHVHAWANRSINAGGQSRAWENSAGNHSHTYNNENDHNNQALTDPGGHIHNPWSTDEGRPAYYQAAFIMKA